jgi:hypothetical protein
MRLGRHTLASRERRRVPSIVIAALVGLSMLAGACTNGTAPPPVPDPVAAELEAFASSDVDAVIERLASAGIATYDSPGGAPIVAPSEPVSPVRLLQWQARNLALEAWAGNGLPGSRLDGLDSASPSGAPTVSQWLAAYVSGAQTPGGDYAREIIGDQDLRASADVEFPQLVAVLFSSDVATRLLRDPVPEATSSPLSGAPAGPEFELVASTACGSFGTFISEVIADVLKALHIPPPRIGDTGSDLLNQILQAGASLVVGFLNWAIEGIVKITIGAAKAALAPILNAIASVSSILAIASQVLGAIRPWSVRLIPELATFHGSVGGARSTDTVQAVVDLGGLTEWPPELEACAGLVGVKLPPLKPIGAPVTWTVRSVPAGLAKDDHHDDTLLNDPLGGKAELRLQAATETVQEHEHGQERTGLVDVSVDIRRNEFKDLKTVMVQLATGLLSGLPDLVRGTAERLLKAPIDAVAEEIVKLVDEHGTVSVAVTSHGPPGPTPTPSFSIPPPIGGGLTGTWSGIATSHFGDTAAFTVDLVQTGSQVTGDLHIPTAICNKEAKVSGTVNGSAITFGVVEGDTSSTFTGTVSGTSMSGTWQSPAGPVCRSDYGTWEASKTS